jgi:X-X-X-Leu-X-X-Gly heptad repeat protein
VARAQSDLHRVSAATSDPSYQRALSALAEARGAISSLTSGLASAGSSAGSAALIAAGVKAQVETLSPQLTRAASGAAQLESGIRQLRNGNAQLANGLSQLRGGGGKLSSGLGQLTDGAGQLQAGLPLLSSGTGQLATGLAGGVGPAGQLVTGLGQMQAAVVKARGQIPSTKDLRTLQRNSPGIFNSGYFVLSAVEGAQPSDRNAATFTINLLRGGTAGQILIVSKYKANDQRSEALGARLRSLGQSFARRSNAAVALGGPAGSLGDLTSVTRSRIWLDVVVLAISLTLVLGLALRAIVLPAVSTLFSLLVVAAAFGVLQLLFGGPNPPLGGPGHMDPMSIIGIFTVAFGISVMFAAVLMMRTREIYMAGGDARSSIRAGLRETAAAATGAGLVVTAAVIPFVTTDLINVRQFGVGVAVAVLLEILIVRPVVLPAAAAVLGRRGWWPTQGPRIAEEEPAIARTRRVASPAAIRPVHQ